MQPRFTVIQGGLSLASGRPAVPRPAPEPAAAGWRVELRRPAELREAEIEEWRAFAARATGLDPFCDPDFLVTAAQHAPRGSGAGIAFALAYSTSPDGVERLRGVVPLALPHEVWGGAAVDLWQAPLAPRPVQPVFEPGAETEAVEAVLDHLTGVKPGASLRLRSVAAGGALMTALRADPRFRIESLDTVPSIPEAQFVAVGARETVTRTERVIAPERIRDAVERFLLLDARRARRPLLPDPAAASTLRVVSRLFARRGLVEVELNASWGDTVSAAIRLGREGERVLWRSVDLAEAAPTQPRTADVAVGLARNAVRMGPPDRAGALRLVVSRGG